MFILSYKDYLVITGTGGTFQYNSNGAYVQNEFWKY